MYVLCWCHCYPNLLPSATHLWEAEVAVRKRSQHTWDELCTGSAEIQDSFSMVRITSPLCQDTSLCIKSVNNKKVLLEFSCGCIYPMPLERPWPQDHTEDLWVHAVGMLQEWEHSIAGVPLWGLRHIRYLYCKTHIPQLWQSLFYLSCRFLSRNRCQMTVHSELMATKPELLLPQVIYP